MNNFAFIIHPIDPQKDVARKFPMLGKLPPKIIDFGSRFFPPVYLSQVKGVCSEATGENLEGWLLACPLTPKRMLEVPVSVAYKKIIQTGRLAEQLGARILGLGAFTSVVGDAGITISQELSIPVTTGNSYTIAVAVEAALKAAKRMDIEPTQCTAAIVGAYGTTGRACAHMLASAVSHLVLIGHRLEKLQTVQQQIKTFGARITVATDLAAVCQADIVLTVTSAITPIIGPQHLKPGAVVCDVARPRNVSRRVVEQRDDVLVIEGGIVDVPGDVDFGFDFGFPPGQAYACMSETMLLALEKRYECYTIGRDISLDRVSEMAQLAAKHGFRLSGFRSFERSVSDQTIERVKKNAYLARKQHGEKVKTNPKTQKAMRYRGGG
jgi:fatty aldehyde-generating acyl-ACP reductase